MSPSENRSVSKLTLRSKLPPGVDPGDLRFSVYDGWENLLPDWNRRTVDDIKSVVLNLPEGIYTVRWEYGGIMEEKVVRLPQQQELDISLQLQTPAPVPGSADTHEYYSKYNGTVKMDETTGAPLGNTSYLNSRLHLLLRARNHAAYNGENLADGLRLLDANLNPLFELGTRANLDTWSGSLLCSLPASSGQYFLEYRGKPASSSNQVDKLPRLFPLHLFSDWQTRLFIFYEDGQPNFASVSLSLVRLGYQEDYDDARSERLKMDAAFDVALNGLQNNALELPKQIERMLLYGKFDNPMLGLLGAHYLLNHPDASTTDLNQETRWQDMAYMVLSNMRHLLPDSPDVAALRFKAALRFANDSRFPMPDSPVGKLPLLRASLDALLQADSETVIAVEEGSLLERMAANLYYDSPWATFRPIGQEQLNNLRGTEGEKDNAWESVGEAWYDEPVGWESEGWLENSIQDALKYTTIQKGRGTDPDWNRLSTSLGVPYRKMMRVVQEVKNQQTQIGGVGNVMADKIEAGNSQVGGSNNIQNNSISVGNISGSSDIAIGNNNRISINQNASADEFDKIFAKLHQTIAQMPEGDDKADAKDTVDKLHAEARKRDNASETRVRKHLNFLFDTAPSIWQIAMDAFIKSPMGLSVAFQKGAELSQIEKRK